MLSYGQFICAKMQYICEDKMLEIKRVEDCCGCNACYNACPKNLIEMKMNEHGFAYPVINESLCTKCGRCVAVCPLKNKSKDSSPLRVIGAKNKSEDVRKTSSSGGTFFELAKQVILKGGIVYGCALNEDMVAYHTSAEDEEGLKKFKSSKYVQSEIGDIYKQVKANLNNDREVLFSGTPCQVAGLKNYLGKEYENLLLIDLLCHGVPSPKLFKDYLEMLSKKYKGKPISVNFRQKKKGWKRLYFEVLFDNGKRYYEFSGYDRYMALFLHNISLRPACYECKLACVERQGDITLGDFWGIGKKYPELDDDKGISLILLNTKKGQNAFSEIEDKLNVFESDLEIAKAGQLTLTRPSKKNDKHEEFYELYAKNGVKTATETYVKVPGTIKRIYYVVMRWGLDLLRKILKKGY